MNVKYLIEIRRAQLEAGIGEAEEASKKPTEVLDKKETKEVRPKRKVQKTTSPRSRKA